MPQTNRRSQKKAETRALLLKAAKTLFIETGYEKTTVRAIAKQAGVATGTVFVHFADKSALLAATLYEDIEQVLATAWQTLPQASLETQLLHLAASLYNYYAQNPALSQVLIKEIIFMSGEWGENFETQINTFIGTVARLFEQAQQTGELSNDVAPHTLALAYFSHYLFVLTGGLRYNNMNSTTQLILLKELLQPLLK